jgi:hypothetical protein
MLPRVHSGTVLPVCEQPDGRTCIIGEYRTTVAEAGAPAEFYTSRAVDPAVCYVSSCQTHKGLTPADTASSSAPASKSVHPSPACGCTQRALHSSSVWAEYCIYTSASLLFAIGGPGWAAAYLVSALPCCCWKSSTAQQSPTVWSRAAL